MKCLKCKKGTLQLTWMSFLQNRNVCFNQEKLPITYHIFRHKSLVKSISYKDQFFTERKHTPIRCQIKYNLPK